MARTILSLFLFAILAAVPEHAQAQFYKGKTVTMIVNYPAGGPSDTEARIVAEHLPAHIPGSPTIVVKNVGGAGGLIGTNQLGEADPNGNTIGFGTLSIPNQILGNPSMRTAYSDFDMIAAVACPLVVYIRKDTPPGIKTAADILKAKEFKALSLSIQSTNTLNQTIALDLLGVKYYSVPAFRGLKEVETAILQNLGQLANSSLSGWRSSVEETMSNVVMPLWQLSPKKDGRYPRSEALPEIQTFEEFYAKVKPGEKLEDKIGYRALRAFSDPQLAMFRAALMPPKSSPEALAIMRAAFVDMWNDPKFLADYTKAIRSEPILVKGEEGQAILKDLANVPDDIKAYLTQYSNNLRGGGDKK